MAVFSICLKANQSLQRFSSLRGLKVSVASKMMVQSNSWKTDGLEEVEGRIFFCLAWVTVSVYVYVFIYVFMYILLGVRGAHSP